MRELKCCNITSLVNYLKRHQEDTFTTLSPSFCPVARLYQHTLKNEQVMVSPTRVVVQGKRRLAAYLLPADLVVFVQRFDQSFGGLYTKRTGAEALAIAEEVRDGNRD